MSNKVIPANYESTNIKYKIPEYAKDFRKEWLYIRGINKKCGEIFSKINFDDDDDEKKLNYNKANNLIYHIKKFLKDKECGRLKDISGFYFKYFDVNNINCLEEQLSEYPYHFFLNRDIFDSDQELLDLFFDIMHILFPSYKDFFELIRLINDKIKKEEPTFNLSQKNKI